MTPNDRNELLNYELLYVSMVIEDTGLSGCDAMNNHLSCEPGSEGWVTPLHQSLG